MKAFFVPVCWILLAAGSLAADDSAADVPFLVQTLDHPAPVVRGRAAAELRTRGEQAAVALAALVRDGNLLSATKGAVVLSQMREDAIAAVPVLLAIVRDPRSSEWRGSVAFQTLRELGDDARRAALPSAIASLSAGPPMQQHAAIRLIMSLKAEAATAAAPLRQFLQRPRAPFRSVVVSDAVIDENRVALTEEAAVYDDLLILEAMRLVGVPEAELAPLLAARATNSRPGVRMLAAAQLAELGPPSKLMAGNTLAVLLDDESPGTREAAIEQLTRLGTAAAAATSRLCRLLRDTDPEVRVQAAVALGQIGPAAGAHAVRSLENAIQIERLLAVGAGPASALARQRTEKMIAALDKIRKVDLE